MTAATGIESPLPGRVYQRIVDPKRGDCVTACIATLLGLPYESVPAWVAEAHDRGDPREGYDDIMRWLWERGWHMRTIMWDALRDWRGLPGLLCLASVPSQRFPGQWHAVVATWVDRGPDEGYEFRVVHDPNPGNAPYPPGVVPRYVSLLVPYRPMEWRRAGVT